MDITVITFCSLGFYALGLVIGKNWKKYVHE